MLSLLAFTPKPSSFSVCVAISFGCGHVLGILETSWTNCRCHPGASFDNDPQPPVQAHSLQTRLVIRSHTQASEPLSLDSDTHSCPHSCSKYCVSFSIHTAPCWPPKGCQEKHEDLALKELTSLKGQVEAGCHKGVYIDADLVFGYQRHFLEERNSKRLSPTL